MDRFLRDGYRTPKEDCARLYYERWELRMFENIECEWPLFYSYLILFHLFQGEKVAVSKYAAKLEVISNSNFINFKRIDTIRILGSTCEIGRWNTINARELCSTIRFGEC